MAAFPDVGKIAFEGPASKNPLAFRHYNANELVEGKSMKDQLRFSVAYWHTMRGTGADPFGAGTMLRPWDDGSDSLPNALRRVEVAFEFMEKLGARFFCFHDRDIAPEGATLSRNQQEPRRRGEGHPRADAAHRRPAALGHRQSLQPSPLRPRRGHQLQRRRLRLRRRPGEEGPGDHQGVGRGGLRFLGRPRRLSDLLEHRHEAGARPSGRLPAHGRRLRPRDRLHRPVLHRAQAEGADQAPVRFRRRRLHQLPPGVRSDRAFQAEHRDQPRHAGRPRRGARNRIRRPAGLLGLAGRQHGRPAAWAGTPTSSSPIR